MVKNSNRRMALILASLTLSLSALSARAALPSPPTNVCINGVCTSAAVSQAPTSPSASSRAVKFHPGTYVWYSPGAINGIPGFRLDLPLQRQDLLSWIDTICRETSIKGIQIVALPRTLEGDTAGDYSAGFAAVDAILAKLAPCNKRLMLSVQPIWFGDIGSVYDIFSAYVINTPSLGWTAGKGINKFNMRVWQQASMDRIIAMVQAYGARYNSHPYVEMLTLAETSMSISSIDGYSVDNLLTQEKRLIAAARAAWPNTAIRVSANNMGNLSNLADLMQYCKAYYCVIGGPDVWPGDIIDASAVFVGKTKMGYPGIGIPGNGADIYEDLRDKLPWAAEVQWVSYDGTWTLQQLWNAPNIGYDPADGDFHMPTMKNRYMIWSANYSNGNASTQWATGILPFIRSNGGAVASTACPTLYPACKLD